MTIEIKLKNESLHTQMQFYSSYFKDSTENQQFTSLSSCINELKDTLQTMQENPIETLCDSVQSPSEQIITLSKHSTSSNDDLKNELNDTHPQELPSIMVRRNPRFSSLNSQIDNLQHTLQRMSFVSLK